ncbi:MAG: DUF2279 domain-containing protein [Bacteroidota bacterium]
MFCIMPVSEAQERRPFHLQHDFTNDFWVNDSVLNKKRRNLVRGTVLGSYALTGLYLGTVWYGNEELSSFHFFDDSHEWKQMDKVGHSFGGYQNSRLLIDLYRWSGMPRKKAIWMGGLVGFTAMSGIEVFDAFGESWGFSWSDVGANFIGSSLAVGNQLLWNENRLQMKVSYLPSPYTRSGDPNHERLFGTTFPEWLLKDYNGQALWLSVRVHSFLPEGRFKEIYPRWLNLAVGYGAEGLEGGYDDPNGAWRTREYRQFYLSLDIDVANIKTRNGFLHTLFSVVNIVRIPLPTLRFDRNGVGFDVFR